jgi:hypothetical protein
VTPQRRRHGDEDADRVRHDQPDDIGLSTFFSGVPTRTSTEALGRANDGLDAADKPGKTLFIVP